MYPFLGIERRTDSTLRGWEGGVKNAIFLIVLKVNEQKNSTHMRRRKTKKSRQKVVTFAIEEKIALFAIFERCQQLIECLILMSNSLQN